MLPQVYAILATAGYLPCISSSSILGACLSYPCFIDKETENNLPQKGSKPRLSNKQKPKEIEEKKHRPFFQEPQHRKKAPWTWSTNQGFSHHSALQSSLYHLYQPPHPAPALQQLATESGAESKFIKWLFTKQFIIIMYLCHKTFLPSFQQMHYIL